MIDRIYPVSGDPVSSTRSTYVQSFFHARLVYELFLLREGTYVPDPPDPRQIRPDLSGTGITGFPVFFRYPVDPVAVPTFDDTPSTLPQVCLFLIVYYPV